MRRLWALGVVGLGAVAVIASLYMPWEAASCPALPPGGVFRGSPSAELPSLFVCSEFDRVDGWSALGSVAALSALFLVAVGVLVMVRTGLSARVPFGAGALFLGYFVVADAFQAVSEGSQEDTILHLSKHSAYRFQFAYGGYVALAAAAMTVAAVCVVRLDWLRTGPPARRLVFLLPAGVVLGALVWPWQRAAQSVGYEQLGVSTNTGQIAAALTLVLVAARWRPARRSIPAEIAAGLGVALFTAETLTVPAGFTRTNAAWVGVAAAVALLPFLAGRVRLSLPASLPLVVGVTGAGAAFVASLFLPWQETCAGHAGSANNLGVASRCMTGNDFSLAGCLCLLLAALLVVAVIAPAALPVPAIELAVALGLLVATSGFGLLSGNGIGVRFQFGYGSYIGFATTGVLILLAFARSSRPRIDLDLMVPAVAGAVLAALFALVLVVPWWPAAVTLLFSSPPPLVGFSWLTLAALLIALHLAAAWVRLGLGRGNRSQLLILPLALAALVLLAAVPLPAVHIDWDAAILLGLALALTLYALMEPRLGIRNLRVPEILRIDRI